MTNDYTVARFLFDVFLVFAWGFIAAMVVRFALRQADDADTNEERHRRNTWRARR